MDSSDDTDSSKSDKNEELSPKKKISVKRKQHFREEYLKKFKGVIEKSRKGTGSSFCNVCKCDFTISHGGVTDITRHINTKKHSSCAITDAQNEKISSFFSTPNDVFEITNAEVLFTEFIMEHSLPISIADHAGKLF